VHSYVYLCVYSAACADIAYVLPSLFVCPCLNTDLLHDTLCSPENRDVWAKERAALESYDPVNRDFLRAIDSAIMVVCLDESSPGQDSPACARDILHGHGLNRWFDKYVQSTHTHTCTQSHKLTYIQECIGVHTHTHTHTHRHTINRTHTHTHTPIAHTHTHTHQPHTHTHTHTHQPRTSTWYIHTHTPSATTYVNGSDDWLPTLLELLQSALPALHQLVEHPTLLRARQLLTVCREEVGGRLFQIQAGGEQLAYTSKEREDLNRVKLRAKFNRYQSSVSPARAPMQACLCTFSTQHNGANVVLSVELLKDIANVILSARKHTHIHTHTHTHTHASTRATATTSRRATGGRTGTQPNTACGYSSLLTYEKLCSHCVEATTTRENHLCHMGVWVSIHSEGGVLSIGEHLERQCVCVCVWQTAGEECVFDFLMQREPGTAKKMVRKLCGFSAVNSAALPNENVPSQCAFSLCVAWRPHTKLRFQCFGLFFLPLPLTHNANTHLPANHTP
jgi:Choline/Carnitine o-acyltransferase